MVKVVWIFKSHGIISGLCWMCVDILLRKSVFILQGYIFICDIKYIYLDG
jgi:hypothetical protein